jgi:hypothetical protein
MISPKKPGVVFWATVVAVVALVAYVGSLGPACWFGRRSGNVVPVSRFYFPVGWIAHSAWIPVGLAVRWYTRAGLPRDVRVALPTSPVKNGGIILL